MPEDSPQDAFIKRKYRLIFLVKPLTWSRLSFLIKQMFFFIEIDKYTYLAIKVWRNCILKTYLLRTRCIMSKSLNWSEMIVDALGLGSHCLQVIRDRRLSCWAVGTWGQSFPPLEFCWYVNPFLIRLRRWSDYALQIFKPSAISGPGTKSVQTAKSQPYAHFGNWKMCHVLHEILVSGTVVNPLLMPFWI